MQNMTLGDWKNPGSVYTVIRYTIQNDKWGDQRIHSFWKNYILDWMWLIVRILQVYIYKDMTKIILKQTDGDIQQGRHRGSAAHVHLCIKTISAK